MEYQKALVAEDELISRRTLCASLEKLGIVPIQCSNGKRAWEVLEDNPDVSLIVTDLAMPDLDGRELVKKVSGHPAFKGIPILVVSGVVGPNEISSILALGASRFLPKPICVPDLKEYVVKLIFGESSIHRP